MKKLFLDDIRQPKDCTYMSYNKSDYMSDDWDVVRNYDEFCKYISNCKTPADLPYMISFDHDLADEHYTPEPFWDDYILSKDFQDGKRPSYKEKTGEDCAIFLRDYLLNMIKYEDKQYIPKFLVHSMNPVGADRIKYVLLDFEKRLDKLKYEKAANDHFSQMFGVDVPSSMSAQDILIKSRKTGFTRHYDSYQQHKYDLPIQSSESLKEKEERDRIRREFLNMKPYTQRVEEKEVEAMKKSSSFFDKIRKKLS